MKIEAGIAYSFHQLGQRSRQEDSRYPDQDIIKSGQPFFVVCDGVGGMDAGDRASRLVCNQMAVAMSEVDLDKEFGNEQFADVLDQVYKEMEQVSKMSGTTMGTTLTFLAFHAGGALAAHIGDSRIYQFRPGSGIIYRSEDHSLVNALVRVREITPDEVEDHPQGNIVTRCMRPDRREMATVAMIKDVQEGDYFLLCTDGVLHQIDDAALAELIVPETDSADDKEKTAQMAKLSCDSADNNTAILVRVDSVAYDVKPDSEEDQNESEQSRETSVFPMGTDSRATSVSDVSSDVSGRVSLGRKLLNLLGIKK